MPAYQGSMSLFPVSMQATETVSLTSRLLSLCCSAHSCKFDLIGDLPFSAPSGFLDVVYRKCGDYNKYYGCHGLHDKIKKSLFSLF